MKGGGGPHTITLTKKIPPLTPGRGYVLVLKISNDILAVDHVNSKIATQFDTVDVTIFGELLNKTIYSETTQGGADSTRYGTANWYPVSLDFVVPFNVNPDSLSISIKIDPFGTDWMLVDEIILAPLRYFNGNGYAVTRGKLEERLEVGDRSAGQTWTNNDDGKIQSFFRKAFGYQLPSDSSATIADSLAT